MRPRTTTSSLSLTEGSCRVYQSTEFCGSDRILVVATFQVHFRSHRQSNDPKVFYVDRLKEGECAQWVCWGTLWSFSTAMQPDRPHTSVEHLQAWITRWSSRINWWMPESDKIFISQEPLEATEVCCTAHLIGYHNLHHSLVHRTRASLLGVLQISFIGKLVVLPSPMKAEIQALLTGDYSPLRKWPDHLRSY